MKLRHQDYYEWYINSCNRCKTCIVGEEGDGDVCPSVDLYEMFNYSGGGKSHLALAAIENRIKNWGEIPESLFSCTFCGACYSLCPVTIDLYNLIIDLREIVNQKGHTPPKLNKFSENLKKKDNPYGRKKKFIPPEGVKIFPRDSGTTLFFTGCQARINDPAYQSAKAALEILMQAGVDIMVMQEEPCCGSPVLEAGDYRTFKENSRKVIREIMQTGAEEIVIHCPHGYSTFLLSYDLPQDFPEIYLFADYVNNLIEEGRLTIESPSDSYSFQDPCRISHYLDESDIFSNLFANIGDSNFSPLPLSGKNSYCCGNPYITPYTDKKLFTFTREKRIDQIREQKSNILVTSCPGCQYALSDESFITVDLPIFLKDHIKQ